MSQENSTYRNTQARMENQIYNLDQDLATARKEAQSLTRAKKDAEKKLTVEVCCTWFLKPIGLHLSHNAFNIL